MLENPRSLNEEEVLAFLFVIATLIIVIRLYFKYNPMAHGQRFMMRRFINWFPLGMSYAFLYLARFNVIAAQQPLSMSNKTFGMIFGAGALTYAIALVFNGPIVDKIGGKRGIIISTIGSGLADALLGYLSYVWLVKKPTDVNMSILFAVVYSLNMYFQSFGAVSIIKVKAYWFHVRERGVFGAIFGTLISLGVYLGFDWSQAIVNAAAAEPKNPNLLHTIFADLFDFQAHGGSVSAVWFVFYIPAVILVTWGLIDLFLIKDTPAQAGLEDFDTHDASSGEMHINFSLLDLMKRVFLSPVMLMIGMVEFFSGVVRNAVLQWYKPFVEQMHQTGAAHFFYDHWGLLLMISGIGGGFVGGYVSDKYFQSRRFPPTAMASGILTLFLGIMAVSLFDSELLVGIAAVGVSFFTITITALMSGTAASDFGGRKATATAAGVTDAFVYIGAAVESFSMGGIIKLGWYYWPLFLIPFALAGAVIAVKMWDYLPEATRRYLLKVENVVISGPGVTVTETTTTAIEVDEI